MRADRPDEMMKLGDRTSKARRRLGGDHRILEHDADEGLGGAPPCVARPGANDSSLYWHDCAPSRGDGLATAQIMGGEHSGRVRRDAIKVG